MAKRTCSGSLKGGGVKSVSRAMTDGLERIGIEVRAFSEMVADANSTMSDIRSAYSALNRARDRYLHEAYQARSLDHAERAALSKVFEGDKFIEGMGKMRGISEHVLQKDGATLYHTDNSPFEITSSSSAAVVFDGPCVTLIDANGAAQRWDHLKSLAEAERRITRAFEKAKGN